jgi:hypothetical protein
MCAAGEREQTAIISLKHKRLILSQALPEFTLRQKMIFYVLLTYISEEE